ncbi:MAG: hypothetical protein A2X82_06900 [Geobacteraceae bacterium GWC2_55_20]|nr:MAG: hypothetical protein A2X82_06900 [Geobacteraceae bacterium GWC2_55_20]OGU18926.1 MAG: hypothetical protein A2X85_12830 [Geobacteraceae bacterium GWF2_54_21]HCE68359.1 hypothetical protein [Geobacter sp.]
MIDNDRKRRKQAEFLIHRFCDWSLIQEIGVQNNNIRDIVLTHLNNFSGLFQPVVSFRPECIVTE